MTTQIDGTTQCAPPLATQKLAVVASSMSTAGTQIQCIVHRARVKWRYAQFNKCLYVACLFSFRFCASLARTSRATRSIIAMSAALTSGRCARAGNRLCAWRGSATMVLAEEMFELVLRIESSRTGMVGGAEGVVSMGYDSDIVDGRCDDPQLGRPGVKCAHETIVTTCTKEKEERTRRGKTSACCVLCQVYICVSGQNTLDPSMTMLWTIGEREEHAIYAF